MKFTTSAAGVSVTGEEKRKWQGKERSEHLLYEKPEI